MSLRRQFLCDPDANNDLNLSFASRERDLSNSALATSLFFQCSI